MLSRAKPLAASGPVYYNPPRNRVDGCPSRTVEDLPVNKMIGWVQSTHPDWFDFLRQRTVWEEVNFWSPSDYFAFHAEPGVPFFFRLKAPRNAIGGFGLFTRFARLPDWLAWEFFGIANGAASFAQLQSRLGSLRGQNRLQGRTPGGERQIGCIILSSAVFFPESMWVDQPKDWGPQNLRPKRYDIRVGEGLRLWEECSARARLLESRELGEPALARETAPRFGEPVLVAPRLGQGAFRVAVTDAYQRACSVTDEHSLPALEAAHIRPYACDGAHTVSNGLLLRSDLHRLFDRGYVTVTPDLHLEVSPRLREDYSNGRSYYPLHGRLISVPQAAEERPDPALLRWHNEVVFRG